MSEMSTLPVKTRSNVFPTMWVGCWMSFLKPSISVTGSKAFARPSDGLFT